MSINAKPQFGIGGNTIDYVCNWSHLGNILNEGQDDSSAILFRRATLIGQVNNMLGYFGKLESRVKMELLYTYCSSIYGSVLWCLLNNDIEKVCISWRIAIKKIWSLPMNTHSNIVSAISSRRSLL